MEVDILTPIRSYSEKSMLCSNNTTTNTTCPPPPPDRCLSIDDREIPHENITAMIVFPSADGYIDWVQNDLSNLPTMVYSYSNPDARYYAPGHCNEGDTYLQYIIDHYHDLPDINIFLHSHTESWHTAQPGIIPTLQTLRWKSLMSRNMTSFTCAGYYIELHRGEPKDVIFDQWEAFERLWGPMFMGEFGSSPPEVMTAHQASSFAVKREAILRRPLSFYRYTKKWCTETNEDPQMTGRVLEYTWHKMFLDEWIMPRNKCCDLSDATCEAYNDAH